MARLSQSPRLVPWAALALVICSVLAAGPVAAVEEEPLGYAADSRPSAGGSHSLEQLIAFALAHNPEVSATGNDARAAQARTEEAQGARWPRLSIEGGYTRYEDNQRLSAARFNGELGVFGDKVLAADLVLRLPLFTSGRLSAEVRAAELLEASAGQRLARSREELVFNVASLYYSLLAQERLVGSLDFSIQATAAELERVNALVAARKAAPVDAMRTEVRMADLRQRLLRERNSFAVQRQALLNLMGADGAAHDFSLAGALSPPAAEPRALPELLRTALHRPDLRAAVAALDAQSARISAARAGYGPSINLFGAVGARAIDDPSEQPTGMDRRHDTSRIGVILDIPLFEGGRTNARVAEERARQAAQRNRLDGLLLKIRLEVETAYTSLASALERLRTTEKAVTLASESERIEREKYTLGRGTVLDTLDAQSARLAAEANHIKALADANAAAAQLALATGENLP